MIDSRPSDIAARRTSPLLARLEARKEITVATRETQVLSILDRMLANLGRDLLGVVVVAVDGVVLAARLADREQLEYLGAIAATVYGITERAIGEFKSGHLDETILKGSTGLLMVLPVSDQALLVIDLDQGGNLGMARLEARIAVAALRGVLKPEAALEHVMGR